MTDIRKSLLWCVLSRTKMLIRQIKKEKYIEQFLGYFYTRHFFASDNQRIYVVTTPEYGNLGDHAIALAEIEFLKTRYPNAEVIDIPDSEFRRFYLGLKYRLKKTDFICMIGGGNMGSLYPELEYIREKLIQGANSNKLIIFPQTIDFTDDEYGQIVRKQMKRIYNTNPRLWILARERKSYDIMQNLFPKCHVRLCPDVVLTYQYKNDNAYEQNKVVLCLRNDKEKALSGEVIDRLKKKIKEDGYYIVECDTQKKYRINPQDRLAEVNKILDEFASSRFIVTDRLHGMIFSHICGVPCLAFDNINKKISGVSEWISNGVCMCNLPEQWEEEYNKVKRLPHFSPNKTKYLKSFTDLFMEIDLYN